MLKIILCLSLLSISAYAGNASTKKSTNKRTPSSQYGIYKLPLNLLKMKSFGDLYDCDKEPAVSLREVDADLVLQEIDRRPNGMIRVNAFFKLSNEPFQACVRANDVEPFSRNTSCQIYGRD